MTTRTHHAEATFRVTVRAGDESTARNIAECAASLIRAEFSAVTSPVLVEPLDDQHFPDAAS